MNEKHYFVLSSTVIIMKLSLFFILIVVTGCAGKTDHSIFVTAPKMSSAQAFLIDVKDSVISQYHAAGTEEKKQEILNKYSQQLQDFLMEKPMDSMQVTIDSVTVNGFSVWTKSHFSSIEFSGRITFKANMPPRPDSVFKFMKNLKPGSDVLVRLGYLGTSKINSPDSPMLPTLIIYAYPAPIQFTNK